MMELLVRNESMRKHLYRRDTLMRLAERICEGEGVEHDVELSLLLCDDGFIRQLNREYREVDRPTDVLSFATGASMPSEVGGYSVLGDIVISLETVERNNDGVRAAMRDEVRLLFCHGLLHLLGYRHDTERKQRQMAAKQATYLDLAPEAAWPAERSTAK